MSDAAATPEQYDRTRGRREALRDQFGDSIDQTEQIELLGQQVALLDELCCKLLEEIFIITSAVARQAYKGMERELLTGGVIEYLTDKNVIDKPELIEKVKELAGQMGMIQEPQSCGDSCDSCESDCD